MHELGQPGIEFLLANSPRLAKYNMNDTSEVALMATIGCLFPDFRLHVRCGRGVWEVVRGADAPTFPSTTH